MIGVMVGVRVRVRVRVSIGVGISRSIKTHKQQPVFTAFPTHKIPDFDRKPDPNHQFFV